MVCKLGLAQYDARYHVAPMIEHRKRPHQQMFSLRLPPAMRSAIGQIAAQYSVSESHVVKQALRHTYGPQVESFRGCEQLAGALASPASLSDGVGPPQAPNGASE